MAHFSPTDCGRAFTVHRGASIILGRQPAFALTHAKISRQHAEISCAAGGASASGLPAITVKAIKRMYVQRRTPQEGQQVQVLQPGHSAQLSPGDVLFLVRDGSTLAAGFSLQLPQQQPAAAAAAGAGGAARPHKRSRIAAGSGGPSSAALGSGRPSQLNKQHKQQLLQGGGSGQASVPGQLSGGAQQPQQQQQQQLFSGVRLVVWDTHHTHQAVARAQQAGAAVQGWIDADTTHVLAGYDMTAEKVQQALQAEQQRRRQLRQEQQQQEQEQQEQEQPAAQSSLPAAATPTAAPPQQPQDASPVTRQLWFSPKNKLGAAAAAAAAAGAAAAAVGGGMEVDVNVLPSCINFVTLAWLTDSLAAKHRLPERPYLIQLHSFQGSPVPLSPASKRSRRQQSGYAALAPGASGAAAASAAAASGGSQQPELLSPATPRPQRHAAAGPAPFGYDAAGGGGAAAPDTPQQPPQQQTPQAIAKQQQPQQKYLAPLPSEVCEPGAVWGEDDRWIEPWDEAAAADTVAQLLANWHRQPWKRNSSAAAGAGAAAGADADLGRQLQAEPWLDDSEEQQPADPGDNGVCEHPACSRQGFCFVAEMQAVKANYSAGRQDQFRVKAALQAIRALERLTQPLVTEQDIDAMSVGPKSREKLKEILGLGFLRRNLEVANSERHRVMELFMSVWGAAESSANKWYQAGCRSLADVVERIGNLTSTQRVGLKYYEDFKRRIPRPEVAECIGIVRQATLETLQELTSLPHEQLTHPLHVRGMGSYGRGKQDCGDMDILIVPGPAASSRVTTEPVLAGVLRRLARQDLVTQDLPVEAGDGKQSWMGVWKGPSSPCHRRVDIKVYPHEALPFAINYFGSGQDFCRALRYWCNKPLPATVARATAMHPAANSFHLSDTRLLLTSRVFRGRGRRGRPWAAAAGTAAAAAAPAVAPAAGEQDGQQQNELEEEQQQGAVEPEQQAAAATAAAMTAAAAAAVEDADGSGSLANVRVLRTAQELIESSVSGPAIVVGEVVCTCESDIFRAVGLAYVPPHMRNFEVL